MPFIRINIIDRMSKNILGLSGSGIYDEKNNLIGIIGNKIIQDDCLNIIPSYCILRAFNEYISNGKYNGL